MLEKSLESSLDCKEIKPLNRKGNQPWIFIGKTDSEAEAPILWPPDVKNWLIGKDPDSGKDRRQEEKGTTETEIIGWHHWLMDMSLSKLQEVVKNREAWHAAVHGVTRNQTWLNNWTTTFFLQHRHCESSPKFAWVLDCHYEFSRKTCFPFNLRWTKIGKLP